MHDFYLWAWFKLGLPGLILFVALIVVAFREGVRAYRTTADSNDKMMALSAVAVIAAVSIASFTGPLFNDEFTVPLIVFVLGLSSVFGHSGHRTRQHVAPHSSVAIERRVIATSCLMKMSVVFITYNCSDCVVRSISSVITNMKALLTMKL